MIREAVGISTVVIAVLALSCGEKSSSRQPTGPSGNPGSSFTVTGIVREKLPSGIPGEPVRGVTVEVVGQQGAAISTVTDADGRYSVLASAGPLDLKLSKDGYTTSTLHVDALSDNRSLDGLLEPILRSLVGNVTDASLRTPVVGARIEIVNGSNKGRITATDTNGDYRFWKVWGDFDMTVSVVGYEGKTVRASVDRDLARTDFSLSSEGQLARSIFTGTLCTVAPPFSYSQCQGNSFPYPTQARHTFSASRPGAATLAVSYKYTGDYYLNHLSVELRCGSQVTAEKRVDLLWEGPPYTQPDNVIGPVQVALPSACTYEIRLFDYIADRKGGDFTTYRVEVRYPG